MHATTNRASPLMRLFLPLHPTEWTVQCALIDKHLILFTFSSNVAGVTLLDDRSTSVGHHSIR